MSKKNEKTSKIYAGIYLLTIVFTVFVLELYSSLEIDFLQFLNVSGPSLYILKVVIFILHWAVFALFYVGLSELILKIKRWKWKKDNPGLDIEGVWLHIHDKEDVKIGVVEIKQDFYDLSVDAENIKPHTDDDTTTKWHYIGAQFKPSENAQIQLIACYFGRRSQETFKQGVHLYREFHSENGKVQKMTGEFGDALNITSGQKPVEVHDKTGKILLYRMTPEIKEYINFKSVDHYDRSKLRWIMEHASPDIKKSEYVKTLQKIYYTNKVQQQISALAKYYNKHTIRHSFESVRKTVFDMLVFAISADHEVYKAETDSLKELTGFSHPGIVVILHNKEEIFNRIKSIATDLSEHSEALTSFNDLLDFSCHTIILSDSYLADMENAFYKELKEFLKSITANTPCEVQ